jgi:uncharacterized protein YdaU (DUF1376 family)
MHHYPFHIGDYVAHTRHLSPIEDLAYRRLLDAYYLREGPLPNEVATTARLIGLRDNIPEVEAVLREFFESTPDGWFNARAEQEIEAYRAKHEQASRAGKASAERRASKRATPDEGVLNAGSTDVQRPLNGRATNQNQNQNQNQEPSPPKPPKGSELFDEFWSAYPRKVGKDAALKAFEKRKPDRELLGRMLTAVALQKQSPGWLKDGGEYIPHPATWLNQGRWQDEAQAVPDRMAGWSSYAREQALRLFPDGNIPAGYVPSGSPAGG